MASVSREAVIKRIREDYINRRGEAHGESEWRKQKIYSEIPEIAEIDAQLARSAGELMQAAFSGGDFSEKVEKLKAKNAGFKALRKKCLEEHGYPGDYTDIKYTCPDCKDTGFIGIDMCPCFKRELSMAMLESSGLGKLGRNQSFENFSLDYYTGADRERMELYVNELKKYAEGFNRSTDTSLLLMGATGLGKTHLSTAVAVKVIERGYDVCYEPVQTLVDDFADCQFRGEGRNALKRYYESDLLIIDDLGTELVNQFTVSSLYNVINHRVNNGKATVISTNLSHEEIRKKYEDRITSRLFGAFKLVYFKGADIRFQKLGVKK